MALILSTVRNAEDLESIVGVQKLGSHTHSQTTVPVVKSARSI